MGRDSNQIVCSRWRQASPQMRNRMLHNIKYGTKLERAYERQCMELFWFPIHMPRSCTCLLRKLYTCLARRIESRGLWTLLIHTKILSTHDFSLVNVLQTSNFELRKLVSNFVQQHKCLALMQGTFRVVKVRRVEFKTDATRFVDTVL